MMMGSVSRATARHFRNARKIPFIPGILMNARKSFAAALVAWAPILALLPLGCGGGGGSSPTNIDPKGEAAHIAEAAGNVSTFMSENKGQVPKSTDELRDWAAKKGIATDSLVSTRDHEPYLIYQVNVGPGKQVVLTEKTGVKGKRFAWSPMNPNRIGVENTEEQIQTMIKGSGASTRGPH